MRDIRTQAWPIGVCVALLAGCGSGGDDGCVPSDGFFGLGETFCPLACVSWTNLVRPGELGTGRFALDPDYTASPPRADIDVGQEFHVRVLGRDLEPSGCNSFLDGLFTYHSTDDAVLAYDGTVFEGIAPGAARVIVDMPTPSGGTETVQLTVCSEPGADPYHCPTRVPLDIRVVSRDD